jgi:hypothetical protein
VVHDKIKDRREHRNRASAERSNLDTDLCDPAETARVQCGAVCSYQFISVHISSSGLGKP